MIHRFHRSFIAGAFIGASLIAASAAHANTITDSYQGGITPPGYTDVVGVGTVFGIQSAQAYRSGPNGNTLNVVISTYYAGVPGTAPAAGTGYGDLFLSPGTWNPNTSGGTCNDCNDVYTPGEWAYVATIPSQTTGLTASGTGNFYSLAGNSQVAGTIGTSSFGTGPGVVTSNVGSCEGQNTTTGCNVYRADQAVGYDPTTGQQNATVNSYGTKTITETYAVSSPGAGQLGTITYTIVDYGLLGNNFALSWAMTCANDVVQGQMTILATEDPVREPPTWAMLLAGLFSMGAYRRWLRTKSQDQSFQAFA